MEPDWAGMGDPRKLLEKCVGGVRESVKIRKMVLVKYDGFLDLVLASGYQN